MLDILIFYRNTIAASIILSASIYIMLKSYIKTEERYFSKNEIRVYTLAPILLIPLSYLLGHFFYSLYPAEISNTVLFYILLIPGAIAFFVFYENKNEKTDNRFYEKQERSMQKRIKEASSIFSLIFGIAFFYTAIFHKAPSGPSASNGFSYGDEYHPCTPMDYFKVERAEHIYQIKCFEKIKEWQHFSKIELCTLHKTKENTIKATDENGTVYNFDIKCEYKGITK